MATRTLYIYNGVDGFIHRGWIEKYNSDVEKGVVDTAYPVRTEFIEIKDRNEQQKTETRK